MFSAVTQVTSIEGTKINNLKKMLEGNDSLLQNNSYTFYGPLGLAFDDDGDEIDENFVPKIIMSIYLGVVMILSLIGNICTCTVIARNRSMRTPTNCYLFNLAVTDLLIVLFIPIEIYLIWIPEFYPFGETGCRIHFMLWDFICNCSILIISAFTIERYLVITRPFFRQKLSLNSRVFKIVGFIWLISCVFAIPDVFFIDLLERKKYVFCYFTMSYLMSILVTIEMIVFFFIPMSLIFVLYALIIIDLKSVQRKLRSSPVSLQQNRDKAVKMLAAVAGSFFFFWSPYCVLRITMVMPIFDDDSNVIPSQTWKAMSYFSYNSYMSPVANPILYSLMSRKFRQAFKDLLKGRSAASRERTVTSLSISRQETTNSNTLNLTKIKLHNT